MRRSGATERPAQARMSQADREKQALRSPKLPARSLAEVAVAHLDNGGPTSAYLKGPARITEVPGRERAARYRDSTSGGGRLQKSCRGRLPRPHKARIASPGASTLSRRRSPPSFRRTCGVWP